MKLISSIIKPIGDAVVSVIERTIKLLETIIDFLIHFVKALEKLSAIAGAVVAVSAFSALYLHFNFPEYIEPLTPKAITFNIYAIIFGTLLFAIRHGIPYAFREYKEFKEFKKSGKSEAFQEYQEYKAFKKSPMFKEFKEYRKFKKSKKTKKKKETK